MLLKTYDKIQVVDMPTVVGDGAQKSFLKSIKDLPVTKEGTQFSLPSDWDWNWVTKKGSMPKRLMYLLKKAYGKNGIPTEFYDFWCAELGRHKSSESQYFLDLGKFEWKKGEFGDPQSCWWTDYNPARLTFLRDEPGYAVRLYKDKDGKQGYARCWAWNLAEADPKKNQGEKRDGFIIFNAYGEQLRLFAHILSTHFGCTYTGTALSGTSIYMNGGGTDGFNGYVLHKGALAELKRYTVAFNVNQKYVAEDKRHTFATCAHCGEQIDLGDRQGRGAQEHFHDAETNEYFCQKHTFTCAICRQKHPIRKGDKKKPVEFRRELRCGECGNYHGKAFIACPKCATGLQKCEDCGEYYELKYIKMDAHGFCPDCAKKRKGK